VQLSAEAMVRDLEISASTMDCAVGKMGLLLRKNLVNIEY